MGRPLKSEGRDTEQAILDAALDVFSTKGFHGASLKDIAAEVGIRDSAIYHYFASKDALFDAILAKRADGRTEFRRALLDAPITDVRKSLEHIGAMIVEGFQTEHARKIFRILMSDGARMHAEGRIDLVERIGVAPMIAKLMERLVRDKWLRPSPPEALSAEFMGPFIMLLFSYAIRPDRSPPFAKDVKTFVRGHVDHFLRGSGTERSTG